MSKAWLRRLLIAATLALSGALALAGPAAAKYIW
jgi:hypothetical protein